MDKPQHQKKNMVIYPNLQNQTRCLQINLQHSRSATLNLMKVIEREELDIIFVQEPYEYQNKPAGIDKKYRTFTAGKGKHRAAIVIPNNKLDAILITQISDEDTVFIEIIHDNLKFLAASMYFDFTDQIENNFNKIDAILQFAKGEGTLIAIDSNSRSTTWYDTLTNTRGKKMEDYLASKQLYIINEESESTTYHSKRGKSNIDLTITNNRLLRAVNGWEISSEDSCSDHNFLKYNIGTVNCSQNSHDEGNHLGIRYIEKDDKYDEFDRNLVQEAYKTFKNVKWEGSTEELDMQLSTTASVVKDLEKFVDTFTETLQSTCRRTFKTISTSNKINKMKSVPWWTANLTIMRKRINALRRQYQRTRNEEELRERRKRKYFEERKKYQNEIKKEKFNSWKEYCSVTSSVNPWSQVYKLAAGKVRNNTIMTTLRKPDGSESTNIQDTIKTMMNHFIPEDIEEEESYYHKQIRKMVEEPIDTRDDIEFTQGEIKQTIESFNGKKAPGIDGITSGIYLRTFNNLPRLITEIYNQCLKRGCFPRRWKVAKIIPIPKPGKENSKDPSKYRPISLLNIEGKVLEKLLITRINYHLNKNGLLANSQYGFTPQKSTTDAVMEAKKYIEHELATRKIVIMTSLDVTGAFDAAWWPSILKGLKDSGCPRNLYYLSQGYFRQRTAVMLTNTVRIDKTVTKGCPQGSCCGPGFWNLLYNSLLQLELTSHSKTIAFADDLLILTKGDSIVEAENFMNLELSKITDWARSNKIRFNENKSKVMLMSRRKRKEREKIEIYVNNKIIQQVNSIKYLGIIFDNKMTFREHVNYIEEKCKKLIFILAKSAKLTWGLKHEALKTIYTGGILPLILYGAPVWSGVLNKKCYRGKIIRIQRLINIKMAKAYRTVSNEALCVLTGLIPIHIKIDETVMYYEYVKGNGHLFDREMEVKYWNHPAKVVEFTAAQEESNHTIQVYTDGSKSEKGVGSGIAIFTNRNLTDTIKYRLNGRCSNNQAEQLAILKALEKIQNLDTNEKTVQVFTDSRITLDALKNRKNHAHLIEQIRTRVIELENQNWNIDFHWVKAHAGHHGNELADQLAKEAAASIENETYRKIPKSTVIRELNEGSLIQWQSEWDKTTKGQITKDFFPVIQDRLKMKIKITPIFTMMTTGHGNLKSYLHKFKIIESPTCPCGKTEQTIDHLSREHKRLLARSNNEVAG